MLLEWLQSPHRRRTIRRLKQDIPFFARSTVTLAVKAPLVVAIGAGLAYYAERRFNVPTIGVYFVLVPLWLFWPRLRRSIRRLLRRMTLLPAVLIAAAGGVAVAWLSWWGLERTLHPTTKPPDPIDITKLALTIAGGVGAIVALVVAYRRQRDIEQGRFVERFGAAAEQLGASQVAVRIAGVYAMTGVADESTGLQRQQCIDVLCGYLRLPYSPDRGSNYQTKHIQKSKAIDMESSETEDHFEYLQNDREVRRTILHVIADHLRGHEFSWSENYFDFRAAYLEGVDFSFAVFKGEAKFGGATFVGETDFRRAKFLGGVQFDEVTFNGPVSFNFAVLAEAGFGKATFSDVAKFWGVNFDGDANFELANFATAKFVETNFWGCRTSFEGSVFEGGAEFTKVLFCGYSDFSDATFKDTAYFYVSFDHGTFRGADFGTCKIDFTPVRRWGSPQISFDWDEDPASKPANVKPTDWSRTGLRVRRPFEDPWRSGLDLS
ncbi:pentapeptide repeat-containing protein [Nocardia transvalensis]|uniref:pentapeptide repeat-containing protein n=1 Tax=Nocardia transvalensis TaxID=37333 RepID=UPI0018959AB7|nr:pentapeptide repeat-containing protein [Nocardia transvalensis]MBF6333312.1 pentapeptide repeat-containing protein [Nocardia transvalensis]